MRKPTMWFSNRSNTKRDVLTQKLETGNFGFGKERNCTIHVAKTKALISTCEADLRLCFRICKMLVFS